MALAMASSHLSLSVAELWTQAALVSLQLTMGAQNLMQYSPECLPRWQDERAFNALDVQLVLIGLLAGLTHLQKFKSK